MIRPVLVYPNPQLRAKTVRVYEAAFDASLHELAVDLRETMDALGALGLAALQIGDTRQVIIVARRVLEPLGGEVLDLTIERTREPIVLVNPVLTLGGEVGMLKEGCLSFPNIWAQVRRAKTCEVVARTVDNQAISYKADGLFAHCLQHEVDHLDGKLLIDNVGPVKRDLIRSKFRRSPPNAVRVEHIKAALQRAQTGQQ